MGRRKEQYGGSCSEEPGKARRDLQRPRDYDISLAKRASPTSTNLPFSAVNTRVTGTVLACPLSCPGCGAQLDGPHLKYSACYTCTVWTCRGRSLVQELGTEKGLHSTAREQEDYLQHSSAQLCKLPPAKRKCHLRGKRSHCLAHRPTGHSEEFHLTGVRSFFLLCIKSERQD